MITYNNNLTWINFIDGSNVQNRNKKSTRWKLALQHHHQHSYCARVYEASCINETKLKPPAAPISIVPKPVFASTITYCKMTVKQRTRSVDQIWLLVCICRWIPITMNREVKTKNKTRLLAPVFQMTSFYCLHADRSYTIVRGKLPITR